uniref:Uncharacterized protein n=1 Tax=Lygus hesperus TaxID=30085 RepID=A0A146LVK6_LYGHE
MGTEGPISLTNQSGGYFGAELATHERIRLVQSQIRIAIQNHHLLYTRSQAFPKDADLENHMKILQDLILSLSRTQLELMYQFKLEVKEKHGMSNFQNIMAMHLGWPDRHEMSVTKAKENGVTLDGDRRAHIMKKKPLLPQSARPRVKMQSLLKVNHNKSILPSKKESERLKVAASKQSESTNSVMREAKKLQSVLKARNAQLGLVDYERRPSVSDDKSGDGYDLKESSSSGSLKIQDTATSIEDVTQDLFLGFFGLIHKDKSKNMVVTQTKRKRRSAAGQTNLYGDFSYFQAKRSYTKKTVASSSVPESPCSSQEVGDGDENDRLSLTSTEKPSEPASPEVPSSQDVAEEMETTPDNATSQVMAASQEIGTSQGTVTNEESTISQEIGTTQESEISQDNATSQETATTQETTISEEIAASQETTSTQESTISQETASTQESTISQEIATSQETASTQESTISKEIANSQEKATTQGSNISQEALTAHGSAIPQEFSGDVSDKAADGNGKICDSVKSNVSNADQAKIADDENLDNKTEPLTPDSDEILKSPAATSPDDVSLVEAMETETSIQDSTLPHLEEKGREECIADSHEGRIDKQDDSKDTAYQRITKEEEQMITEDCRANESNVDPCEKEILLRYSPETDTVEVLPSTDLQSANEKPESQKLLRYSPETDTVEVVPSNKARPVRQKPDSPGLSSSSPKNNTEEVLPSGDGRINRNPVSFDIDDRSNDTDPTSFIPNDKSQNPECSSPSKSNVCGVCFGSSDEGIEKCGMCGEVYHKECAVACPSCHDTPSSISSIVGVDTASRLTSTDCSEVIKRYLSDTQEEGKGAIEDSDDSREGCDGNDYADDQSSSNVVDPTEDKDHDDFNDSMDRDVQDRVDTNDSMHQDVQDRADVNNSMDVVDLSDSADDQVSDINDYTVGQDDDLNPQHILLDDDDSLVFPNSVFEDNSCNSSL